MISPKKTIKWIVNYSKVLWKPFSAGGIPMTKMVIRQEVNHKKAKFEPVLAYKNFNAEEFCAEWHKKLDRVEHEVSRYEYCFSQDVNSLIKWVRHNGCQVKDLNEIAATLYSFDSLEIVHKILKKYDEQFELLINDCESYDEFRDSLVFLQDLPHEFKYTLKRLVDNTEEYFVEDENMLENRRVPQENKMIVWKEGVDVPTPSSLFLSC